MGQRVGRNSRKVAAWHSQHVDSRLPWESPHKRSNPNHETNLLPERSGIKHQQSHETKIARLCVKCQHD